MSKLCVSCMERVATVELALTGAGDAPACSAASHCYPCARRRLERLEGRDGQDPTGAASNRGETA